MKIFKLAAVAAGGLLTGALMFGSGASAQDDPAFEHGYPDVAATSMDNCGEVSLTFTNPTPWLFVFDVRIDGEEPLHDSVAPGVEIGEGPLAGQEFGPRWRLVEVDGRASVHEATEVFEFDESVEVRLAEGAEQKLYFDWRTLDVSELKCEKGDEEETEPTDPPAGDEGKGGEELAETGLPTGMLALGALGLVVVGGALYLVARRRVSFTS